MGRLRRFLSLKLPAARQSPPAVLLWRHVLAGTLACLVAGKVEGEALRAGAPTFEFASAVNWNFQKRPKLDAWQNTAVVIRKTLDAWFPPAVHASMVENTDRAALHDFFSQLAQSSSETGSIIYLASHQGRDGLWHFPHDAPQSWAEMLPEVRHAPARPRFVIVDACFAEAADPATLLAGTGATGVLYASSKAEVAHELNFHNRFPIDLTRDDKAEAQWLRSALGPQWNGRISFLGFVWLHACLATPRAPRDLTEWQNFFGRCEAFAAEFRRGRGADLAATLHFVSAR